MMAYGFQGSLLGVRAVQEDFSLTATGFMMSGYFVGYFIGAATPNIISELVRQSFVLLPHWHRYNFSPFYFDTSIYLFY